MRLHCWLSIPVCLCITNLGLSNDLVRVLQGKVVTENGDAIEDALIEWGYFDASFSRCETSETDHDGNYRLESVKVGPDFRLGVSAPGFAPVWIDRLIPGQSDNPDTRTITLKPGGTLTGNVVDENGAPLEGITILAKSASKGFYSSFSMPIASYRFPGPAHSAMTNSEGNFKIVDLPGTVSTMVGNDEDGEPIFEDQSREFTLYWKTARGISPRGNATCGEPAHVVVKSQWLGTKESTPGVVRFRVVSAETNQPIENIKVGLRFREGLTSFSNPDGVFVLVGLIANKPYEVHVFAEGYSPGLAGADAKRTHAAKCYVSGGVVGTPLDGEQVFECRLERSPSYRGRIVSRDGTPVSNAEIVFGIPGERTNSDFHWPEFSRYADGYMGLNHVQRMTTAKDGRFSFSEGSTKGVLAIIAPGYGRVYLNANDRPESGDDGEATINLVKADASITGTVLRNGAPDSNVSVSAWPRSNISFGGYSLQTKSDENGKFALSDLEAGEYFVSVSETLENSVRVRITHRISLAAGEHRIADLGSADGFLSLSGSAPPFCWIQLESKNGDSSIVRRSTFSSADGKYVFEGLKHGEYELESHSVGSAITGSMGRKFKSRELGIYGNMTENISWR